MTKRDEIIQKFINNPVSLKYNQIEQVLVSLGFEKIVIKGSHRKFKHHSLDRDLIIPVHNNECKSFYKKLIAKTIKQFKLY